MNHKWLDIIIFAMACNSNNHKDKKIYTCKNDVVIKKKKYRIDVLYTCWIFVGSSMEPAGEQTSQAALRLMEKFTMAQSLV